MFDRDVYLGVFVRAAELVGGMDRLAEHLGVAPELLASWASGRTDPPPEMFLKAVDLHVEHSLKGLVSSVSRPPTDGSLKGDGTA